MGLVVTLRKNRIRVSCKFYLQFEKRFFFQKALVLISDWFVCKIYIRKNNSTKIHEIEERLANGSGIHIRKLYLKS